MDAKQPEKSRRMNARALKCTICGAHDGVIHKYGLNICRRCFREHSENIGFHKYS